MTDELTASPDLFENAPCGLLLTAADDSVTHVNQTFLDWTGYSRGALIGRDFHTLLDAGSAAFYATRYQAELWVRGEAREVALTLVRADGSAMPILVNSQLVVSDAGERSAVRLAVFDSTARQDYEREMLIAKRQAEVSEASVRVLQEASTHFLAASSEEEIAVALARSTKDAFAAFDTAVVLFDEAGDHTFVVGEHLAEALVELDTLRTDTFAVRVDGMTVISSQNEAYASGQRAGDLMRLLRAEAITAAPISDGETTLGAFLCLFGRPREFDHRSIELHHALARQAGVVIARARLQSMIRRLAMHDQLTGLANRNLLGERLSHSLAVSKRTGEPMALLFVDLDGFKRVNDELGHRVGDLVLQTVADRMTGGIREVDIVGRFGGDEFLVVCESSDREAALVVAERLAATIRLPIEGIPDSFPITASIGIAMQLPGEHDTIDGDALVRRADAAMYVAKRSGSDRISFAA